MTTTRTTTTNRRGATVLANPRNGYPLTYANRTQASAAAAKWGGYVIPPAPFARAWQVGITLPTADEVASCN